MTSEKPPTPPDLATCKAVTIKVARAAAQWWVNEYLDPKPLRHLPKTVPPTEALEAFASAFEAEVLKYYYHADQMPYSMTLTLDVGTDYQPHGALLDAIEAAGLGGHHATRRLPSKVVMKIGLMHVLVADGYRAPFVYLIDERPWLYRLSSAHEALARAIQAVADLETFGPVYTPATDQEAAAHYGILKQGVIDAAAKVEAIAQEKAGSVAR